MVADIGAVRQKVASQLVGRVRELDLLLAAVSAGCDVVLEGPPGTSKTTMLKAITREWNIPLVFVEGNGELTASKLIGHHDPVRVLKEDYSVDNFVDGPLVQAMRAGGFLYIEELNRAPDETLNSLLAAIADREIVIPRVGVVDAAPTFRVIASMNPYDNVGTTRLSTSIHDRLCRLAVGYQDGEAELEIVAMRSVVDWGSPLEQRIAKDAVAVTRATREHPDVSSRSSVRGAIDVVRVARKLFGLHQMQDASDGQYATVFFGAVIVALSGRIHLADAADRTPESVLAEICDEVVGARSSKPG